MRYVLVEDVTNKILEEVDGDKRFRSGTPPDLPQKPFRWLPLKVTDPKVPDDATHIKDGPVTKIEAKRVTKVYTVRKKTAKELDADKDSQLPLIDSVAFKIMLDIENRTRVIEKRPSVTALEYRTNLKSDI
jgi:hypothetical protein